jgi:transposase-like protein
MSTNPPDRPPVPPCPRCRGTHVVRNGLTHSGTPGFLCRACDRRFVVAPLKVPVSQEKKDLVLRLLGERMAIRAIARVTGLSRSWLQRFVNALYREQTPHEPGPLPKKVATS